VIKEHGSLGQLRTRVIKEHGSLGQLRTRVIKEHGRPRAATDPGELSCAAARGRRYPAMIGSL